jgi:uncharacterized protein (TIGR03083 family)
LTAVPAENALPRVQAAIDHRTARLVEALSELDEMDLTGPSRLRGWSRLTIACHLRYGAETLRAMTEAVLSDRPVSFYPEGRAQQRPGTLLPNVGEHPSDVVESLARHSERLSQRWASLNEDMWNRQVLEPEDNVDLGPITLGRLALLRLTEVQVHGSDLGLHLEDWSPFFIEVVLPMRLDWLKVRRVNHHVDDFLEGAWLLVASDGPTYRISVSRGAVESVPASRTTPARAVVEATSRDLLALLLGRPFLQPPRITGDVAFGQAFSEAFPGP